MANASPHASASNSRDTSPKSKPQIDISGDGELPAGRSSLDYSSTENPWRSRGTGYNVDSPINLRPPGLRGTRGTSPSAPQRQTPISVSPMSPPRSPLAVTVEPPRSPPKPSSLVLSPPATSGLSTLRR